MVDLSNTIIAKSDQLNADDLREGPITVRITRVIGTSDKEQPIAINYEGDNGKPYKPGKSMRRVLVWLWGKDGNAYVGRSMTLYCDPTVTFGKIAVGGIRISHMSDLDDDKQVALQVKKGAKAAFHVRRLSTPGSANGGGGGGGQVEDDDAMALRLTDDYIAAINDPESGIVDLDALREWQTERKRAKFLATIRDKFPEQHKRIVVAHTELSEKLAPPVDMTAGDDDDDDTFPLTSS